MNSAPLAQLPWPIRQLNKLGRGLDSVGLPILRLSESTLLTAARRDTGLLDFGPNDFREPLRRWIEAFNDRSDLSLFGRMLMRHELVRCLSNRLRIQQELDENPQILDLALERPIFIVGLPRTGTTLLHNLLALAPRGRAPLMWELLRPAPAPRPEHRHSDPRIQRTRREVGGALRLLPSMRAIHPLVPTGPDECFYLFNNMFMSPVADAQASVPGYMQWLMQTDMTPAYRYYRTQLLLLQRHIETEYWLLKTPTHLFALDALLAVFPDARIIQTHRDPRKVVASCCSLYETSRVLFTETVNPKRLGQRWLDTWGVAIDRTMDLRTQRAGEVTFYDLRYEDFIADPVSAVRSIHDAFELDFDDAFVARMRQHLDDSPKKKFGAHRYTLERYGLSPATVASRFARYIDRFVT